MQIIGRLQNGLLILNSPGGDKRYLESSWGQTPIPTQYHHNKLQFNLLDASVE